jgi:hypothetical protein
MASSRKQLVLALALLASCVPGSGGDADRDGLGDAVEPGWGSDPFVSDTDGDGVSDGVEVLAWEPPDFAAAFPRSFPTRAPERDGPLYAASHDAAGRWELTAWNLFGHAEETFAILGRPSGGGRFGLAFDQHGYLYVARGLELARVHPFTGAVDRVVELRAPTGAPVVVLEIAYDPYTRALHGVERSAANAYGLGTQIVRIDVATGMTTRVGQPLAYPVRALAFVYAPAYHAEHGSLFRAAVVQSPWADGWLELDTDQLTGATPIGSPTPLAWPVDGLAFNSDWYVAYARATAPAAGSIDGGGVWNSDRYPRAFGAIAAPPACAAPCFEEAHTAPFAGDARVLESADLDGDGDVDLVAASRDAAGGLVESLLNDGAGGFTPAASIPLASEPTGLAIADFDADAVPDAIVWSADGAAALRGSGAGFEAPWPLSIGAGITALVAGAVTPDGVADLVVCGSGGLGLHAGDGLGGFAAAEAIAEACLASVAIAARGVAGADVIGLAGSELRVYAAAPGGGWQTISQHSFAPDAAVLGLATGDLDADGIDDVVATVETPGGPSLDVFLRDAQGSLTGPLRHPIPALAAPAAPRVADVTGDGRADVLVLHEMETIVVLIGDGSGALVPALRPDLLASVWAGIEVESADLDADGIQDPIFVDGAVLWLRSRPAYDVAF